MKESGRSRRWILIVCTHLCIINPAVTQKNTAVRYSLSAIKRKAARGASKTRANAPEAPAVGEDFWKRARVVMPSGKTSVHLRIDTDIFEWFKKRGQGHLTRMNAVLRSYVEAQKR